MTSQYFFGILLFIVFAKGIVELNEPFLVALCFVGFVYTVYTKLGNDIYNSFNARYEGMVNNDREYISKYRSLLKDVIDLYKTRISLFRRLHRMGKFFKGQTARYIEIREMELRNQVGTTINTNFQTLSQKEVTFRLQFQQDLVNKLIKTLKDSSKNIVITELVRPLSITDLENYLKRK